MLATILTIGALLLFLLAAVGVPTRANLTALGLAFLTLVLLLNNGLSGIG